MAPNKSSIRRVLVFWLGDEVDDVDAVFVGERVLACRFLLSSLAMLAADGKSGVDLGLIFMHLPPLWPPLEW